MNNRIIAFAIAALFAAGGAVAGGKGHMGGTSGSDMGSGQAMQPHGMGPQAKFSSLDTNGDGYISPQEIEANEQVTEQLSRNWNEADRNKDGWIDEAEFAAYEQEQMREQQMMQEQQRYRREPGDRLP